MDYHGTYSVAPRCSQRCNGIFAFHTHYPGVKTGSFKAAAKDAARIAFDLVRFSSVP